MLFQFYGVHCKRHISQLLGHRLILMQYLWRNYTMMCNEQYGLWQQELQIANVSQYLGRFCSVHVAEFTALVMGMETALQRGVRHLTIMCDSELVFNQVRRKSYEYQRLSLGQNLHKIESTQFTIQEFISWYSMFTSIGFQRYPCFRSLPLSHV